MSDTTDGYADIVIRFERSCPIPHVGIYSSVVIDVEGLNHKVSLVFPTGVVPQHITIATCDRWVDAVQGSIVGGCGIDDDRRQILLHLCLGYRAFVCGKPGARPDDWFRFCNKLVVAACDVAAIEQVGQLRAIVEWLYTALPHDIFSSQSIPAVTYTDTAIPARPTHILIAPDGLPPNEQVVLRKALERNIATLIVKALCSIPPDGRPEDFPEVLATQACSERNTSTSDHPPSSMEIKLVDGVSDPDRREQATGDAKNVCLYLTVGIPSHVVGSVHTPIVDILRQCAFHKVHEDGSTEKIPNPLAPPTRLVGSPPSASSPPPGYAVLCLIPTDPLQNAATPSSLSKAASTPSHRSPPISSSDNLTISRSRKRRVAAKVNAMSVAAIEVRRTKDRRARDARAAARAARRMDASKSEESGRSPYTPHVIQLEFPFED